MNETKQPMSWSEVYDPTGVVMIRANFKNIENEYLPEEVQEMLVHMGMMETIRVINEHMNLTHNQSVLYLTHDHEGQKILVDYKRSELQ